MTLAADEMLAESIRRSLWRMGWESLRPLQQEAIRAILGTQDDVILAARTAAGKTEAAFLPILSEICEAPLGSIRALYVGPLKALINDQFRRLEELSQYAEIPVHRWHGDVPASKKRRLIDRPSGVLLITPESLESLFVNKSSALSRIFHSLSFVVIDELHAMLGSERGTQLRSQLFRLERHSVEKFRMVALSATIGDRNAAARWMRPDGERKVRIICDESVEKAKRYRVHAYVRVPVRRESENSDQTEQVPPENFVTDVYENFRGTKNLIFANSKAMVEDVTDRLNELAKKNGTGADFLIHHGSLSRDVREDTEKRMQEDRPHTTVCSSTLELGIDIGNVRTIGQVGPTWSVSSLVQRLGRSGRKDGEPNQMRVFVIEDCPGTHSDLAERLFPDLLQAIAVTELMLEPWVESPDTQPFDLSTLLQQTLSAIAETGGTSEPMLFDLLVRGGAFRFLDAKQFSLFLHGLTQNDLIEQRPEGPLILGLVGETIVRHYDFYAAFAAPPEYRVVYGSRAIGRLSASAVPRPSDHILLAGRRWQVLEVDDRREEIAVRPASGRKLPLFPHGVGEIGPRIRQKMREVLLSDSVPDYLDSAATKLLKDARLVASQAGMHSSNLISCGLHQTMWFPWTGSRAMRTLHLMLQAGELDATPDRSALAFTFAGDIAEWMPSLTLLLNNLPSDSQLIDQVVSCERRKWDRYVLPELLAQSFLHDALDVPLATTCLRQLHTCDPH